MREKHVIRDVLHGYVLFDDLDRELIDCRVVQRLRHIHQNDVASFVYPSLNTTRFEHSLGVMHVAGLLAESAINASTASNEYLKLLQSEVAALKSATLEGVNSSFCRAARWYGLLHDVGHLPFSHLTEHCLSSDIEDLYGKTNFSKVHEAAGAYLICNDPELKAAFERDPGAGAIVGELMSSKGARPCLQPLKDIVDSDVDADRIDSTARDGLQSGGDYGNYDISRLTRHARLWQGDPADEGPWRVFFTTRAESAVESLLVERLKTHRWVHYKPKVMAFKNAYRICFEHIRGEVRTWHAKEYVSEHGFLDDASALAKIAALDGCPRYVGNARAAILWRWPTARPLWKRREGFRALSVEVTSAYRNRWWADIERRYPALNLLVWAGSDWLRKLEDCLNENLDEEFRFLVSVTDLKPFSPDVTGAGRVGAYRIIRHYEPSLLRVTDESRMVSALAETVKAEAAFVATVIVPRDTPAGLPQKLMARFKEIAGTMLDQVGSSIPNSRRAEIVKEVLDQR